MEGAPRRVLSCIWLMNQIPHEQNSEEHIRLLVAQRHLYGRAKHLLAAQVLLSFVAPVLTVASLTSRPWIALIGLGVALVDALFLDPGQVRRRELAARVQELFDCDVLRMTWNEVRIGAKPEPEDIHQAAHRRNTKRNDSFYNWYPPAVSDLPAHVARAICQRANVSWDSRLRLFYRGLVAWVVAITSAVVISAAMARGLTVESMTMSILAPLAPLLLWSIREWQREGRAIDSLKRLSASVAKYVDDAIDGKVDPGELDERARLIQDEIYDRRRQNPLIFDWIYRLLKRRFQDEMIAGADMLITRYRTANSKSPSR